jgi:hypothetical protein
MSSIFQEGPIYFAICSSQATTDRNERFGNLIGLAEREARPGLIGCLHRIDELTGRFLDAFSRSAGGGPRGASSVSSSKNRNRRLASNKERNEV